MYSLDAESITRYWLPYGHATTDSIAVDGRDVWFYFSGDREKHIGRITKRQGTITFNEYSFGISGPPLRRDMTLSREARMEAMSKERWVHIGQGIAAKGGKVWYGEARERWRFEKPDTGFAARSEAESWAVCKMETGTGKISKYVFPEPDKTPHSLVGYRISTDVEGRMISGATYANGVWIFDTRTRKLRQFVLGRILEDHIKYPDGSEHTYQRPELMLKDVAMSGDGKRCWAIDSLGWSGAGALYELRVDDESILRHTLQPRPSWGLVSGYQDSVVKTRSQALSLGPDGRVWLTCEDEWCPEDRRIDRWKAGFIISFDPRTSEMTSYQYPEQPTALEGIVVTSRGDVWYGFRHHDRWGVRNLSRERRESAESQPEEIKAVEILDGEAAEVDGGEALCQRLNVLRESPVRRSIREGSISLQLGGGMGIIRKLAEDTDGHIWFSTWGEGCIGVLTPSQKLNTSRVPEQTGSPETAEQLAY